MITNTGKSIISKYLIGQAPAYASYIAVGCGVNPLNLTDTFPDFSEKTALDFEMFRVPIVSRGFVNENGINKVVLTAELPTEERYEITEIGVYSAGSNPSAGAYDSRVLYAFTQNENWEYHSKTAASAINAVYTPLDGSNEDNIIVEQEKVFQTNADNRIFTDSVRLNRNERCRFLNNIIVLSGDLSKINVLQNEKLDVDLSWVQQDTGRSSEHIHLNGVTADFNKQSPLDELKLCFSVINKNGHDGTRPDKIRLILEFATDDAYSQGQSARFEVNLSHIAGDPIKDFTSNRYFVVSKQLQELTKTQAFSWGSANILKVYASVIDTSGNVSSNFLVCLDALRIENTSSQNPLYGLTGYSVIKNTNARPIVKSANTTNFIEFRFNVGVS
jgi:hypothetical protein